MSVRFTARDKEFLTKFEHDLSSRMELAAEALRGEMARSISTPQPPSQPGEPPHADTGKLRQSLFYKMADRFTAVVGSSLAYALFLELGTHRMAARPFMRPALMSFVPRLKWILQRGR